MRHVGHVGLSCCTPATCTTPHAPRCSAFAPKRATDELYQPSVVIQRYLNSGNIDPELLQAMGQQQPNEAKLSAQVQVLEA